MSGGSNGGDHSDHEKETKAAVKAFLGRHQENIGAQSRYQTLHHRVYSGIEEFLEGKGKTVDDLLKDTGLQEDVARKIAELYVRGHAKLRKKEVDKEYLAAIKKYKFFGHNPGTKDMDDHVERISGYSLDSWLSDIRAKAEKNVLYTNDVFHALTDEHMKEMKERDLKKAASPLSDIAGRSDKHAKHLDTILGLNPDAKDRKRLSNIDRANNFLSTVIKNPDIYSALVGEHLYGDAHGHGGGH